MKKIRKPPFITFRAICQHCGCEFEYDFEDVDGLGSTVRCPCCDHFVVHDAEDNGVERRKPDE